MIVEDLDSGNSSGDTGFEGFDSTVLDTLEFELVSCNLLVVFWSVCLVTVGKVELESVNINLVDIIDLF